MRVRFLRRVTVEGTTYEVGRVAFLEGRIARPLLDAGVVTRLGPELGAWAVADPPIRHGDPEPVRHAAG